MSQQNVEIVRRGVTAATRRPKPDFDAVNGLDHPDHEFVSRIAPLEGVRHGAGGFRDWLHDLDDTADLDMQLAEIEAIDPDRVLYMLSFRLRGKSSGVDLEQETASIATVLTGKIIRTETYRSCEEALKAARLEEVR